jgi:type VI secretion system protein ImpF
MPELTPKERLQPALLDRLLDDEPTQRSEPRERRVLSLQKLRECVIRDLGALLSAGRPLTDEQLEGLDHVAKSVLAYGMPHLTGFTASTMPVAEMEQQIRRAIVAFEPRLLPHTLRIRAVVQPEQMNRHAVSFEIRGDLWAEPLPLHMFLRTELDLETGGVVVESAAGDGKR